MTIMQTLNWRIQHLMLEHALETLSTLELEELEKHSDRFTVSEFPLILEDMKEALHALKHACLTLEQTVSASSVCGTDNVLRHG